MTQVLISGSAGFIGHHLVSQILEKTDWEIVAFDRLNSDLSKRRWAELNFETLPRIKLLNLDFSEKIADVVEHLNTIDYLFHLGAETNISKSIRDPFPFIKSNVGGTFNFLELARKQKKLRYFIYISTNEVFGSGQAGEKFGEWHKYNCLNPYSATKAAAEDLSLAYSSSYRIPVMIVRTMNLFGERQDPHKFIPRTVGSIVTGTQLPIYTNESGEVGSRAYLYVDSFISALLDLLNIAKSTPIINEIDWRRDKFNIAGVEPISNLVVAQKIADIMGKPLHYELLDYYSNEPAHELHSALDCSRIMRLGLLPKEPFDTQLAKTVRWLIENTRWLS